MFGLININKPAGLTSRDVVNHVQRLVKPAKAGHAGTLDPLAEGVLVVCIGQATRLITYVQQMQKSYTGTFLLGRESASEDTESDVVELPQPVIPTEAELVQILPRFVGEIQQKPPAFSALKVAGRRSYDLARRGQIVEHEPRTITIHTLELLQYDYPMFQLAIECGSGTYIRSLGRDIAKALGTAAVMSALVRTGIGSYKIEQACQLQQITSTTIGDHLLPAESALDNLPKLTLTDDQQIHIIHGLRIENDCQQLGEFAAFDRQGSLVAILQSCDNDQLRPKRVFKKDV